MVTIDYAKCNLCKQCILVCHDYCITINDKQLKIDNRLCDSCTQCISVCPKQALSWNGNLPQKVDINLLPKPEYLEELFKSRRSIRLYKELEVETSILEKIAEISRFAPTMNKNIKAKIITNRQILNDIENIIDRKSKILYKFLFTNQVIYRLIHLFKPELRILKSKIENRKYHLHNAPAMIILTGNPKIAMSDTSAQYYLYNMSLYSFSLGLGSIISDATKIFLNTNRKYLRKLNISNDHKILGVLLVGYSKIKFPNKVTGLNTEIFP
jgi:NAD-dependent dihydropyrimidine dehydrogenase PreA subunit